MAGKQGRSGRLPQIGIANGTDSTLALPPVASAPSKPEFVCDYASEFWDEYADILFSTGRLHPEDGPLFQSACELWGLYCKSYMGAQRSPADKDWRIAVTSYWQKFEQAAARFGLNPADRQRIKTASTKHGVRRRQA